jgi:hypothetical protein
MPRFIVAGRSGVGLSINPAIKRAEAEIMTIPKKFANMYLTPETYPCF